MSGKVYPLHGSQRDAADPQESVWLSASAGTGKTQVLSARVLRLLLEPGVHPSQLLCLTFTKAGAAEMAVRVGQVLARWVRLPEAELGRELGHLGAPLDPETRGRARALFAQVLDCPGGGLRIDTIHAFAQYLLAAFPAEAGILPGSRPLDDRERDLLSRRVLSELVETGDPQLVSAIEDMSRRKGPDAVMAWLLRCAGHMDLWQGPGSWIPPLRPRVRKLLGIPAEADRSWAAIACAAPDFDDRSMEACLTTLRGWDTKGGREASEAVAAWMASSAEDRLDRISALCGTLLVADGSRAKNLNHLEKRDPDYAANAQRVVDCLAVAQQRLALLDLADFLTLQLTAGRTFALAWDEAKSREGWIDFDDQIARAARLLGNGEMADWIRYKLDRTFDHILVDEAQDTNRAQWQIIEALIDDFFSGEGAAGEKVRTIFTVGDFKQAIFGFQGTSPRNFSEARERVRSRMDLTADALEDLRGAATTRRLRDYGLGQSFRTAAPVLDFVDAAMAAIGPENMGLADPYMEHVGEARPGLVTLWNTVQAQSENDDGEGDESWLGKHDRKMADNIARQVRQWMDHGFPLEKGTRRNATPGDVMVLVRKRRDLAALIVARLYRHGVPVAGIDRLRLGNPLAVKDLMAAIRFAAQPLDDLNLASLLVSPIIGWTQDDLLAHGYRAPTIRLWDHLRAHRYPDVVEAVERLRQILRRADYDDPQSLLRWILVGPLDGRRKLVARLGREANDPIDELLNAAGAFAAQHVASLQGFIRWFDAGSGEIKREAGENADQVRVMTVHGSKGLQAPIVILADAAIGPDGAGDICLNESGPGAGGAEVPVPSLRKGECVGPVAAAVEDASAAAMEEHWRLLYVAMTRAEEALFIGGSLGPRDARSGVPKDSWYGRLRPVFDNEALAHDIWGAVWEWGERAPAVPMTTTHSAEPEDDQLPAWATTSVGPEPVPPRPLAPSGLGDVEGADPPLSPSLATNAARRGILLHALLERLPLVAHPQREILADTWLQTHGAGLTSDERDEIARSAIAVIDDPRFATVFSSDALAEVPLAAVVDGQVVLGTVDRLLVTADRVTVVDFKTARRPPTDLDSVPATALKQMAAYVAALEKIYPGREIEAALLYTQTPALIALPTAALAPYKSLFSKAEESYPPPAVE